MVTPAGLIGSMLRRITGTLADSFQELRGFPELIELLAAEYRLAEKIENLDVWVRSVDESG